jgi:phosphatidate cytidylyltransferase
MGTPRTDNRAGRDMPVAIGVGVTIAVIALLALRVGPAAALALVTLVIGLGTAELLSSARRGGHHPAVLLGLVASVGLPLAVYWRGVEAYPLMAFLVVAAGLLWYVFGVDSDSPASNLGITLLAVAYVGGLGSFAAMILRLPGGIGTDILLAIIIPTVADQPQQDRRGPARRGGRRRDLLRAVQRHPAGPRALRRVAQRVPARCRRGHHGAAR